ncbi:hypothetical protein [Shewanella sp. AC91-MNA-CIBAN-0169]|uniref:hypothetical protein n=1 Tax=Shewanella sp. AC91-MNA-CIBAN-0169 TaxID=3140466 RepID=UPI00333205F7
MICFDVGWAYLADYQFWNERTGVITAAVAVIGLFVAWYQVCAARRESRRATAYAAYDGYLKLCIEHTTFASGDDIEITNNPEHYHQYKWFVANMLFAFEQVLETCKGDKTWAVTIKHQLKRHKWHLEMSSSAERPEWSDELKALFP